MSGRTFVIVLVNMPRHMRAVLPIPGDTSYSTNVDPMLAQRRRRWANNNTIINYKMNVISLKNYEINIISYLYYLLGLLNTSADKLHVRRILTIPATTGDGNLPRMLTYSDWSSTSKWPHVHPHTKRQILTQRCINGGPSSATLDQQ